MGLLLLPSACGGSEKEQPAPEDVDLVVAAVADIVYQCGSYTTGQVTEPDEAALERDVDALVEAYDRLEPDASFEVGAVELTRTTTLREELRFAARTLADGCLPAQAQRLSDAAG